MTRLAFRNLFQNKFRLLISIGGVALALLLILAIDAIFSGVENRLTLYIRRSGADLFVAQSGVRNMHMASSTLPVSLITQVEAVPGVSTVTPILYLPNMIVLGKDRSVAYIIGLPENAPLGGPWKMASGRSTPAQGEAIIDKSVADSSGVGLGGEVQIMGKTFTVTGLSEETASLVNSFAFISLDDFAALRGRTDTVSYLLVKVSKGESPSVIAKNIQDQVGNVSALSTPVFASQERKVVSDMSTDVVNIMNLIGFAIGLAVMALTVYTATLSRRAEYGVLKALGARNSHLYRAVLTQALISVAFGFAISLAITFLLSNIIPSLGSGMVMAVSEASLLKVGGFSFLIAGMAAILPIRQIAGLDPAMVFRGK